jgi:peptide-methionine (S)-S-oxide reductase
MLNSSTDRFRNLICMLVLFPVLESVACSPVHGQIPAFAGDSPSPAVKGKQIAVLAGGCFWGVDAVFRHVKGVAGVATGYSGGSASTAQYEAVSAGTTGHAESVKITFDPSQVSYAELLRVFFSVATDPTQLNRQGLDEGTQYRSVIFYANEDQKQIALAYIDQLNRAKVFRGPIVTQVAPLKAFHPAEEYHQNFLARNPTNPYIIYNDLPKLHALQKQFPDLYKR